MFTEIEYCDLTGALCFKVVCDENSEKSKKNLTSFLYGIRS
jgi:hypothetical protein